jgi:type IX secretion system substrate protein
MKKIITLLALAFCLNGNAQCTLTITVNSATICTGSPCTLTATGATSYTWSPATGLSATTGSVVTSSPVATTDYTVTGTTGTCTAIATAIVTVNLTPLPPTTITNPVKDCKEVAITLSVTPSASSIPVWYKEFNHNYVTTGSTYTPSTSNSQTEVFSVIDSSTTSGCTSSPLSLTVTVEPLPSIIINTITIDSAHCGINNGNVIINAVDSSAFGGTPPIHYQWYNTSGLIPNDTSLNLTNVAGGTYSLHITDANGCNATTTGGMNDYSVPIAGCAGIQQYNINNNISIYPNPANKIINLELKIKDIGNTQYTLYDVNGKVVKQVVIYNLKSIIDVSDLNEGVYNISISSSEGVVNKRIVIVK